MPGAIAVVIALVAVAIFLASQQTGAASGDAAAVAGGTMLPNNVVPLNSKIQSLANAIAAAEGFGIAGAVPTRANNPGDLVFGDKGFGTANLEGVTNFPDVATGWSALYTELNLIFSGGSHVYNVGMTFAAFAQLWTGGDNNGAWAATVTQRLGIDPSWSLGDWFNA